MAARSTLNRVGTAKGQAVSAAPGLLERETELAAIEGLAGAEGGRLLAIEGPPGIGKTALLHEARALAEEAGMQVLGGRGSELERSFSYGVVRQLFEPLLASLTAEERSRVAERGGRPRGAALRLRPSSRPSRLRARRWRRSTASTG